MYVILSTNPKLPKDFGRVDQKVGGHEITLSKTMGGALEHTCNFILIALGVAFGLLIVGNLMMPRLQQILGMIAILQQIMIAIISIPFVLVGGFFLSAFFPQKKEVTQQ